jgi:putative lipoprotein
MPRSAWLILAVALVTITVSHGASAEPRDDWFGRDKALHFGISAGLAGAGYAAGTALWRERWKAFAAGGALAIGAGAAKEAVDATGAGDPSWRDFTWDVAGAAVGLGVAYLVDLAVVGHPPPLTSSSAALHSARRQPVGPLVLRF